MLRVEEGAEVGVFGAEGGELGFEVGVGGGGGGGLEGGETVFC